MHHLGIDISAGQVNNILTRDKETFHCEKGEVLQAGLQVSSYVGVDDTGARHRGHNGSCLLIGNDLFAYFHSSDSKSRLNFLETLRQPHADYVTNEVARAYWADQKLSAAVTAALGSGAEAFADVPCRVRNPQTASHQDRRSHRGRCCAHSCLTAQRLSGRRTLPPACRTLRSRRSVNRAALSPQPSHVRRNLQRTNQNIATRVVIDRRERPDTPRTQKS